MSDERETREEDSPKLHAFTLLSGAYEGNDYSKNPVFDPLDPQNTARARWPSLSVRQGGTVYSDTDLVRTHGADKFRAVGEAPPEIQQRYDQFLQQQRVGVEKAGRFGPTPTATQQVNTGGAVAKVPGVANTPGKGPNPTMVASMVPGGAGDEFQTPPTSAEGERPLSLSSTELGGGGPQPHHSTGQQGGARNQPGRRTGTPAGGGQGAKGEQGGAGTKGSERKTKGKSADELEQHTVEELREMAEEEEIDLSGARTKAEIISRINDASD